MAEYRARLLDSVSGNEGAYVFHDRDDLMSKPADDVVAAFFAYAERELFRTQHIEYELNGVIKNPRQRTVVAIGQLHRSGHFDEPQPFTLFIGQSG
jgi:hypothetical protein